MYYIAALFMRKKCKIYTVFQMFSAVVMILVLVWFTVSTPFVYAGQQQLAKQYKLIDSGSPITDSEEETSNPFGNNTEEKTPSTSSFSEEYLHNNHKTDYFFFVSQQYQKCANAGTYIAFHGELLVPPPNAS